jgi:hypothetical protein
MKILKYLTIIPIVLLSFSTPVKAETVCQTNSLGDKNCITGIQKNGNFSAKISWTYKVPRNTIVPGKSIKYSEWGANVICTQSPRYANVTYSIMKDQNNKSISLTSFQLKQIATGLQRNAAPKLVYVFCG